MPPLLTSPSVGLGGARRPCEVRAAWNNYAVRGERQPWKVKKNSSIRHVWVLMREEKLCCRAAAAARVPEIWKRRTLVIYCSSLSWGPGRFVRPAAGLNPFNLPAAPLVCPVALCSGKRVPGSLESAVINTSEEDQSGETGLTFPPMPARARARASRAPSR